VLYLTITFNLGHLQANQFQSHTHILLCTDKLFYSWPHKSWY